jgi:tetratricopeptide (TPR) repeat protein
VVANQPEGLWERDHDPLTAGLIADARAAQELGDTDRAVELAENAVEIDPGAVVAWDLLVEVHRSAGQPAQAADACHRMLSSEQVTLAGFEAAQREQRCAMLLIEAERLDDAERWGRSAVERSYGRLEPMVTLSAVLLDQERPREVIQLLEGHIREGVGAGRVEVAALTNLGAAYALLGEAQAAAETYQAALAIDPEDTGALINLADAYQQLGQPEQAAETLRQILAIDPNHAEARRRLGQ